jgi:hypothetical protein
LKCTRSETATPRSTSSRPSEYPLPPATHARTHKHSHAHAGDRQGGRTCMVCGCTIVPGCMCAGLQDQESFHSAVRAIKSTATRNQPVVLVGVTNGAHRRAHQPSACAYTRRARGRGSVGKSTFLNKLFKIERRRLAYRKKETFPILTTDLTTVPPGTSGYKWVLTDFSPTKRANARARAHMSARAPSCPTHTT